MANLDGIVRQANRRPAVDSPARTRPEPGDTGSVRFDPADPAGPARLTAPQVARLAAVAGNSATASLIGSAPPAPAQVIHRSAIAVTNPGDEVERDAEAAATSVVGGRGLSETSAVLGGLFD